MAISNVIEKLGRAIFEAPFSGGRISKDAPELAEIRLAVLDAVKAKSHRASGKHVFPYNVVRVELLGVPQQEAAVFQSDFLSSYLADELKTGLKRSSYRFPAELRVEIRTTPKLPMPNENWLAVETELEDHKIEEPSPRTRRPAKLIVIHGSANHQELLLSKVRTNIGRTAEVFREAGPSRRNDLVFTEDNEINRTVSREHAHIVHSSKTGEYRIINDRWYKGEKSCGIWIVRDSLSQPVHRGVRGTVLKPGDEIHLGNAVLRFQAK
ncbi:MAG TPA: FHA domain-containing protein [Bryobacteraceae bacterium]|nr:FHA domain-containing protein [Bryobacteraceae bacterium]